MEFHLCHKLVFLLAFYFICTFCSFYLVLITMDPLPSFKMFLILIATVLLQINLPTVQCTLNTVVTSEVNIGSDSFQENVKKDIHPQFAYDLAKTKKMALVEETLVDSLTEILNDIPFPEEHEKDLCHIYLTKYLQEFEQDKYATRGERRYNRANVVAQNPILTLKMIRRMVVTLLNHTLNSCSDKVPVIATTVNSTFRLANLPPPNLEDLDSALLELLRIHYIHGLNATTELRLGLLNGEFTDAFLYFDDCLALGKKAVEIEAQSLAYQWLLSAPLSPPEIIGPQEHLVEDMRDHDLTWMNLLNLTLIGDWDEMYKFLRDRPQDTLPLFSSDYSSDALCRGESTLPAELESGLSCFYNFDWDPYFLINPVKTEVLSEYPVIFQFYDFANEETINYLIQNPGVGKTTRVRIKKIEKTQTSHTIHQSSDYTWISVPVEQKMDPFLANLNRKIEKLTGLEVHKKGASNMQVNMHGALGGHYDLHHDALQLSRKELSTLQQGDRIATLLLFLSDVKMGGYTTFPHAGVFARPIRGSAVLWYPLQLNGLPDEKASHSGCPVVLGMKRTANIWIMQYENMWKHPCSWNPEE